MQELISCLQILRNYEDNFTDRTLTILIGYPSIITRIISKSNNSSQNQKLQPPFKIQSQLYAVCQLSQDDKQTDYQQLLLQLCYNFFSSSRKIRMIVCFQQKQSDNNNEKNERIFSILKKVFDFESNVPKNILFVIFKDEKNLQIQSIFQEISREKCKPSKFFEFILQLQSHYFPKNKQDLLKSKEFIKKLHTIEPISKQFLKYNLTDSFKLKIRVSLQEIVKNVMEKLKGSIIKLQMKLRNSIIFQQINLRQRVQLQVQIIQFLQEKLKSTSLLNYFNYFKIKYGMLTAFTDLENDLAIIEIFQIIYQKAHIYMSDIVSGFENILNAKLFEQQKQLHQLNKNRYSQISQSDKNQSSNFIQQIKKNTNGQQNQQKYKIIQKNTSPLNEEQKNEEYDQQSKNIVKRNYPRAHQRSHSNIEQNYQQRQQAKAQDKDLARNGFCSGTNKVRQLKTRLSKELGLVKNTFMNDHIIEHIPKHKRTRSDNPLQKVYKIEQLIHSTEFHQHVNKLKMQKVQHQRKKTQEKILTQKPTQQIYQSMKRKSLQKAKQSPIVNSSQIKRYSQKWSAYLNA